jgi:hypothetical protein
MIRLADIVTRYAPELLKQRGHELLPSQLKALTAFGLCRSASAPQMLLSCDNCDESIWLPHSCGNRHCPHCQTHESQLWIDKQLQKLVPGEYFMVTFTLPAEFRPLAWDHQRELYELIIRNAWATVNTFSQNDRKLRGSAGAVEPSITKSGSVGKTARERGGGGGAAHAQPSTGLPPPCTSDYSRRGVRCQTAAVA